MENAIPPCGLYERCDSYGGRLGEGIGTFLYKDGHVWEGRGVSYTPHGLLSCNLHKSMASVVSHRQHWGVRGMSPCDFIIEKYHFHFFNVRCVAHSLLLHRDLRLPGHETLNLLWNSILSHTYKRSHVYTHFFPSNHYFTLSAAHTAQSIDFHEQNVCAPQCNKGTHVILTPRNIA